MTSISNHWSSNKEYNSIILGYMFQNLFELLMSMLHVSDNQKSPTDYRLNKIQSLINILLHDYNSVLIREQNLCNNKSIVPLIGRLKFRQYISNKKHRYGNFFLNYVHAIFTHPHIKYIQEENRLLESYMDNRIVLCADNWYFRVDLAEIFLCCII